MSKTERIKELVTKLNRYSIEYYTLDNPSISDKEYDLLYDELLELEKETNIILPNSPTKRVGDIVLKGFEKVQHKNKLWSLDKSNTFDEVKDWINSCNKFVNEYNKNHTNKLPLPTYIVTKKFDGLTVKCDYQDINFIQGSSRGTGLIGEKLTEQVKTMLNLPQQLLDNDKQTTFASFHGEGLMTHKALEDYNNNLSDGQKLLKNCRNGIAGALRNLNVKETAKRKPIIYFYNINDMEKDFQTYQQQLEYMKYRGLPVAEYELCKDYDEVTQAINNIEKQRDSLPFDIDGAVIALNDLRTRELMGYTDKFPKYSLSYKYEAKETTTKLIDVEWNVGRTGKVTPKAIIEPVDLMGSTVQRATLNNISDIKRKGIKINARVFIRKSNDVIPEITGVVDESLNSENIIDIIPPTNCLICNSKLVWRNDLLYCNNEQCNSRLIKQITHYCSRQAMNIEGLSEKTIEKFIEQGFLKSIIDIYSLSQYESEIVKLDGFGVKSYNKLIESIEKSKQCKLENFIFGLGIPNVGLSTAKDICKYFNNDTDKIMTLDKSEYTRIDGIGDIVANSIVDYFNKTKNIRFVNSLISELTFIEDKPQQTYQEGILKGKTLYLTGTFNYGKKKELQQLVETNGGVFSDKFNKSCDYLVIGSLKGSTKGDKAIKMGIEVLQEDEFLKMLGVE